MGYTQRLPYLSHVAADLTRGSQESDASHPLSCAQSCLPCEVMEVTDQPLHDILHAGIGIVRVYQEDVLRDILSGQILQRRDRDLRGIHFVDMYMCVCLLVLSPSSFTFSFSSGALIEDW